MRFSFDLKKKEVISFIALVVLSSFVIAYGGTQPNNLGHTGGEIEISSISGSPSLNNWASGLQGQVNAIASDLNNVESDISVCPTGTNKVGDFCIDSIKRNGGLGTNWVLAVNDCANLGMHLCSGREWVAGCRASSGSGWGGSSGEWAGDVINAGSGNIDRSAVYGIGGVSDTLVDCHKTNVAFSILDGNPGYRCCKNLV